MVLPSLATTGVLMTIASTLTTVPCPRTHARTHAYTLVPSPGAYTNRTRPYSYHAAAPLGGRPHAPLTVLPHPLESELVASLLELREPVFAQTECSVAGAEAALPRVRKRGQCRRCHGNVVEADHDGRLLVTRTPTCTCTCSERKGAAWRAEEERHRHDGGSGSGSGSAAIRHPVQQCWTFGVVAKPRRLTESEIDFGRLISIYKT